MNNSFITGGGNHSFVLTESGNLFGSGLNNSGQLSLPVEDTVQFNVIDIPSSHQVTSVACGWDFSLLLATEGVVFSCGSNKFGQLLHPGESIQVLSLFPSYNNYFTFFIELIPCRILKPQYGYK